MSTAAAVHREQLPTPIEWMRFCYQCNAEHVFIADRECLSGLIGRCSHCGDERIAPFTRSTSEVWEALT